MTHRVLVLLVMLTASVLPVMPRLLVPLVMPWWMVSLVMLALMVVQGTLPLTVPLVMTTVRVLQVMVLGVGLRIGGHRRFPALALAIPGGGPGGLWWSVGLPALAVLVASGVEAGPHQSLRRVLMVRLVYVMVLSVSVASAFAGVAAGYVEGEVGVRDDGAGGWLRRW